MHESESAAVDVDQLPLKTMGLKPGMALQTRRLVEGASKSEAQYYGAIESKGVMVAGLGNEANGHGLHAGEICVVRGFTGQYEFSFVSKVLQTFEKPFAYALLAYPSHVDARKVRQSLRTRVSWPCAVVAEGSQINARESAVAGVPATLVDLSPFGAMIRTASSNATTGSIGPIGSYLALSIHAEIDSAALELRLRAKICHNNRAPDSDDYLVGMEFVEISGSDRQWLVRLAQAH